MSVTTILRRSWSKVGTTQRTLIARFLVKSCKLLLHLLESQIMHILQRLELNVVAVDLLQHHSSGKKFLVEADLLVTDDHKHDNQKRDEDFGDEWLVPYCCLKSAWILDDLRAVQPVMYSLPGQAEETHIVSRCASEIELDGFWGY